MMSVSRGPVVPIRVKLMNEYTVKFPLWVYTENGDVLLDEREIAPTELGTRLGEWAETFNEYYSYEDGWPSHAIRDRHYATGVLLFNALQAHFGPSVPVDFDYWEISVAGAP